MSNVISAGLVDGYGTVTRAVDVTTRKSQKRYKRWPVEGGHGLEVTEMGKFWDRHGHPVRPSGAFSHLINPGRNYVGPVLPAYGDEQGRYLSNPDSDRVWGARTVCYTRLAAELVANQFLKAPPEGWDVTVVFHLDGNRSNPALDNLRYLVDEELLEAREAMEVRRWMQHEQSGPLHKLYAREKFGTTRRRPGVTSPEYLAERLLRNSKPDIDIQEGGRLKYLPSHALLRHRMVQHHELGHRVEKYDASYCRAS